MKLAQGFAEEYPHAPPKEAQHALLQTDCCIALLDIERGKLHTLCFGRHCHRSHILGVVTDSGQTIEPVRMREHTVGNSKVFEAAFEELQGQQHVVLGSPGLWCAFHASFIKRAKPRLFSFVLPSENIRDDLSGRTST
jgi:hypothetical protein